MKPFGELISSLCFVEGANAEIRRDLQETRLAAATANLQLAAQVERMQALKTQLRKHSSLGINSSVRGASAVGLPFGLSDSAQETVMTLETHLAASLKELEDVQTKFSQTNSQLEEMRQKFAHCRHKQELMYRDFLTERRVINAVHTSFINYCCCKPLYMRINTKEFSLN